MELPAVRRLGKRTAEPADRMTRMGSPLTTSPGRRVIRLAGALVAAMAMLVITAVSPRPTAKAAEGSTLQGTVTAAGKARRRRPGHPIRSGRRPSLPTRTSQHGFHRLIPDDLLRRGQ